MKVRDLLKYCELHEWRGHRSKATLRTNIKQLNALIGDDDIAGLHYTRLKTLASQLETHGRKAAAPATVKRKLDTLSNALTIATKMTNPDGSPDQGHEAVPAGQGVEARRSRQHPDYRRQIWAPVG